MTTRQIPSRLLAQAAAPAPAAAGHRPLLLAMALAAGFAASPPARAQPTGAQAIHGSAALKPQGSSLVVTTTNGAGTRHSAINWQSFSIPGGSTTHFAQPDAASTSINRVIGANPSAIFGTLSSNGRLVLVNPAGITVGAGAVVDTAGFTASTLRMSDADAIAGLLRFGDGSVAGALRVDGQILARVGDVVLIGTDVQAGSQAVIQSPQGATVLAAGQKVEVTGRGLEGIRLEVQAPADQAVNLGTLQGDAVGIFAGTLRHSGLVNASAATVQGGKVVLRAGGDALVDGAIVAKAGDQGGSIDVFGQRVGLLAGANLDASGQSGGGQVRVGGDYQGQNAGVPNAARTYVDAAASIKADAVQQGDGGRVIVWSDEVTRMHGQISARGGAQGGDGGFAEVSGKQYLDYTGLVDLRAPQGATGTLLLDPQDVTIVRRDPNLLLDLLNVVTGTVGGLLFEPGSGPAQIADSHINAQLATANVIVKTDSAAAASGIGGQITVDAAAIVQWSNGNDLALEADKGIDILGTIQGSGTGAGLHLNAKNGSIRDGGTGTIIMPEVYASATNGSVVLTSTNHAVGTVAGQATGTGASFSVNSNQDLAVGTVNTAWGGGTGISAATVQVSSANDLSLGAAITASAGGSVTAKAGRYLSLDAAINSQGGQVALESGTIDSEGAIYINSTGTIGSGGGLVKLQSLKSDVGGSSLLVQGVVDAGAGGIEVRAQSLDVIGSGVLKRTGPGDINVVVDGLNLANSAGTSLQSTGGRVVVNPMTPNASGIALVGIGGTAPTGSFGLGAAALGQIEAKTLVVGNGASPNAITLSGDIAFNPLKVQELSLITSSSITQSTGTLTVDGVNLDANSVTVSGANAVNRVSGRYDTAFTFNSGSALAIDTVDGIAGVQLRSGKVAPASPPSATITSGGKLTVNQVITGDVVQLSAMGPSPAGGVDLIANVIAGNLVSLTSGSSVVVQSTSLVSAPTIQFNAPQTDVYGKVKPGGLGAIGMARASGNLSFRGTGTAELEVASLTSFDQIVAGGVVSTDPTTGLKVLDLTGGKLSGTFQPVSASGSSPTYALPALWTVSSSNPFAVVAGLPPAPLPPAPAPAPAPVVAPAPVPATDGTTQQTAGEVVAFAEQFTEQRKEGEERAGKDDIVLTETSCKPRG
nr:filamentous hemagglutinin N-terminal domain-containing protein [Ramlibacter henchirensis]